MLEEIKIRYIPERLQTVDPDFLDFEESMITEQDQELVQFLLSGKYPPVPNPHNSIILYVTGLSNVFDVVKARANTTGGSPPDVDIDFEALGRDQAVDQVIARWGRDNVANIITHGTFKPKSLSRRFFKITEPEVPGETDPKRIRVQPHVKAHYSKLGDILGMIPDPAHGKEATVQELIEGNDKNGWKPHPELATEFRFAPWKAFAEQLEGMVANFGIHAAGIVISEFPIYEQIPMWKNGKSERITQYDMHEVEELGLIKFDFLVINNLDIIKECCRLIQERHGITINPYEIPDGDKAAYALMHQGILSGVFQMETSGSAKDLIARIEPINIEEISDISALNRPGPLQNGFDEEYITNRANGYAPEGLHPKVAKIIESTFWTIVYQEQVMAIVSELAGFTLKEADDVRRAMGKKKIAVLEKVEPIFVKGCAERGIDKQYASDLWEKLIKFAEYGFNKSHSVAYSLITYICAYLKANYPKEFFSALMTIRSKVMQPKLWAQKAPQFVNDARQMDIKIHGPSIQKSGIGFTIHDDEIYFGLNAIKGVGISAAQSAIKARGNKKFEDIWDFLSRISMSQINTKHFGAMVHAGAFDKMGYLREELVEKLTDIYKYYRDVVNYKQRLVDSAQRSKENVVKAKAKEDIERRLKEAKALAKPYKKSKEPIPDHILKVIEREKRLREYRAIAAEVKASGGDILDALTTEQLTEYEENLWLRKKPELKVLELPEKPELQRVRRFSLSVKQLMMQADMIGCYLGTHPARILFPNTQPLADIEDPVYAEVAGVVMQVKEILTRKGDPMCFVQFGDGTSLGEGVVFPSVFKRLSARKTIPQEGDVVKIRGLVDEVDPMVKILVNSIEIHRRNE